MFLENKYTKWYNGIIHKARIRHTLAGYSESHHVLPRSLGGIDEPTNLVELTAKEHLVCHILLTKMVSGDDYRKMLNALWAMATLKNRYHQRGIISSRQYAKLKEAMSKERSKAYMGGGNPFYGKHHSAENKKKLSERIIPEERRLRHSVNAIERFRHQPGTFYKKRHTDETKQKIREKRLGSKDTIETRRAKVAAAKNRPPISEKTRYKISVARKGKGGRSGELNSFYGKTHSLAFKEKKKQEKLNAPKKKCAFCLRDIDQMNYSRWHGLKCKENKC